MLGYLQLEPRGTKWQRAYFTTKMVGGRWLPLFDQYFVRRNLTGTMNEIQQKAKEEFGDMTVYITEDNRVCFGDIPLQSIRQQCRGIARRIKKHITSILGR